MSIRRCPVPIVNFILPKGVRFGYCRKSHNPSDVSLNITFFPIYAIRFDNQEPRLLNFEEYRGFLEPA
jgi:hypothetical protein